MTTVKTDPTPDYKMILDHLTAHFGDAMSGLIEIAWRDAASGKLSQGKPFALTQIHEAAEWAVKVNSIPGQNCYLGAALRHEDLPPFGRCNDTDFLAAEWLHVDLDDEGAAERARDMARTMALASYAVVTGRTPYLRVQMWWRLDEPITDADHYRTCLEGIAAQLNGDPTVTNPSRVMRLGGTVAWPTKPGRTVAEMTEFRMRSPQPYDIAQLERVFSIGGVKNTPTSTQQERSGNGVIPGGTRLVPEGQRDAYRRDVIIASFVEYVGENGAEPSPQELYDLAHPIIERGIGQPDAQPEIRKTQFKIKYLLGRFAHGRLPGMPTLDAVAASYQARKESAPPSIAPQVAPEIVKAQAEGIRFESVAEFLNGFTPPDYLIDGIMQRRYLYSLTAPTGHGKTAVCIELALCIVQAIQIGPYEAQSGNVVYLCGENPDDVRARLLTISRVRALDVSKLSIYLVDGRFDIGLAHERLKQELDRIGGASLVIVDTLMAYFTGDDDNSNAQMAAYARDVLRPITKMAGGPCVLVPSHPVKNPSKDNLTPRGGGAFLNEVDGNLTLWADGEGTTEMHWAGKIRGPSFNPLPFALEEIKHPTVTDSRGRVMTSIMARVVTDSEAERKISATRSDEDELLEVIQNFPKAGLRGWAEQLGWVSVMGVPLKDKVKRRLEGMKDAKLVRYHRREYRLTDLGESELKASHGTYKAKPSWRGTDQ